MGRSRTPFLLVLSFVLTLYASVSAQVSGLVSDPELKPFIKAQVEFSVPDSNAFLPRRYDVSSLGTFHIDPGPSRLFSLNFTAAFCEPLAVMIYLPKPEPIRLDVRLRPYAWVDDYKDVRVIGDFNRFSRESGAVSLRALSDGTYFADVNTLIDGKMSYRLTGLVRDSPLSVPGTHADKVSVDGDGRFASVLFVKPGRVRILFDPAELPTARGKAEVIFDRPDSTTAKVASAYAGLMKRAQDHLLASSAFRGAGHDTRDLHYDWSAEVAKLGKQLEVEKNEAVRQVLWIALLDLGRLGSPEVDKRTAQKALKEIPPESELWQLAGQNLLFDTIGLAGGLDRYGDYFRKVITSNPSRLVRAFVLERAYLAARQKKDLAKSREYYAMLIESYGDLLPAQRVRATPPETRFAAGRSMPPFSFAALDDPKQTLTPETFKGKCYLIDFWAAWYGPCVAEMDNLHKLHAAYGPKGFEIVSVSFDKTPDDVRRFRGEKWPMPWRHAFLGMEEFGAGSKTSEYFELAEIPHGILVDPSGRIVATGDEARGAKLAENLAKLFGH